MMLNLRKMCDSFDNFCDSSFGRCPLDKSISISEDDIKKYDITRGIETAGKERYIGLCTFLSIKKVGRWSVDEIKSDILKNHLTETDMKKIIEICINIELTK